MLSTLLYRLRKRINRWRTGGFPGSQQYWEDHYRVGGTSGSGSGGRLAAFKARVVDRLVKEFNPSSIVELGCGDGHQLAQFAFSRKDHRPVVDYRGLDVSPTAIAACRRRFAGHDHLTFSLLTDATDIPADLALSLDVIFHLTEDDVFEDYMNRLFASADRYVLVYSSDTDENAENAPHFRNRKFSGWITKNRPEWRLVKTIKNPYPYDPAHPTETSVADFYLWERKEAITTAGV
ncbi:trans-aconitate 2-methyltransferase [Lewinella sp. W8]|uniref:class I SAM-dependent methyltransferase n=1 Tax=Lewinella sp. W8 TaxID=2528208 RepID=UPI00106807B7|nr:class I SAM-dependent methyltransferase [Lewinella sp. W8]MTB51026.1 methyltransferase domain-containing protein [Lewinella sp. W8]